VEVKEGPYRMAEGPGPEYETCGTFGTMLGNADLAGIIMANESCNRLGVDTITAGATIAFAMDCFEKGVITKSDTDGINLCFGNIDAAIEMVKKIASRTGLGEVLALGSARAARRIGKGAEGYAITVKGLEVPMHDPRGSHGLGLAYMMSNIGASHMQHVNDPVERGITSYPEVGMNDFYQGQTSEGKAMLVKLTEDIGQPLQSMCLCQFIAWGINTDDMADMVRVVTGFDFNRNELLACGARSWLIKRAINNLMGVRACDDRLPKRILTPLEDGMAAGSTPDEALMKSEYYKLRGLNEDGIPTREALEAADLPEVASRLYSR
jgi:aldehyde:ferredoxin oxidoreductase